MQDTEMSDVEKFPIHEAYCSITEFNSLSSAFPSENNFSSIPDDLPLSNNFGCYNDSILGNINAIIHHADEKEIQRELGFSLLDENVLDPLINIDISSLPSSLDEAVNISGEILENGTNSNSLTLVPNIDKRRESTKETNKTNKKTKRKSKISKNETKLLNLEKSSQNEKRYFSQATVTVSKEASKSKSDKVKPIPKLIIKLTPRPIVPETSNTYFAPTIADKVKMGRRRQTNKLTDYEFSSMIQNFEKTQRKPRKRQKNTLSSVDSKVFYSESESVKSSDGCKMINEEESRTTCKDNNFANKSSSALHILSQNSNVVASQVVSESLASCTYSSKSNFEKKSAKLEESVSENGENAIKNFENILIEKEIKSPGNNKQKHVKEKIKDFDTFENFSVESCIEIAKEEPIYEESNLFSELFGQDMKHFFANESVLTDELEKAIFGEETRQGSMNELDLETINATFNSELFDNQIDSKNDFMKGVNNICCEKTNLSLSEERSTCVKKDYCVANNVSSADSVYESKCSLKACLPSAIASKVVLEKIEVSTPELELPLYEHVNSPDIVLSVNTQQVPYSSEDFNATQVLNERSLKVNNALKKENFPPAEIHSYEAVSPLHPNISRKRNLSSSSSTGSQSSYSCYSSGELPNSSSSPNSCFSPGKRLRRNSKSHCNYDKKQSSRHFRVDAVSCTNYENHVRNPKNSLQYTHNNQDNFRHRNESGSSSSSQSSSPHVRDHNHYRSLSKSFSRDSTGNYSHSRSRSPSHSQKYRPSSKWKRSPSSSTHRYQIDQRENFEAIEERRVLYVGDIPPGYTVKMLKERFSRFGPIEDVQIKSKITNYVQKIFGFVTFKRKADAFQAIERGNDNPLAPKFDLNFGGRRRFCNGDYTDLDGKVAEVEGGWNDYQPKSATKDDDVFATLLAMEKARQESLKIKK